MSTQYIMNKFSRKIKVILTVSLTAILSTTSFAQFDDAELYNAEYISNFEDGIANIAQNNYQSALEHFLVLADMRAASNTP